MNDEAVSLSTNWMSTESATNLVSMLKKIKLKQAWFADFDWETSKSIFFCTVPEGGPCNFKGTDVFQYETSTLPLAIEKSEREFSQMLKGKGITGAELLSKVIMGSDEEVLTVALGIGGQDDRIKFSVRHTSIKFSDLVEVADLIPKKLKLLVERQDRDQSSRGKSVYVDTISDAFNFRREILIAFSGDVSLRYGFGVSESDALDLSKIGKSGLGFDVSDATPTDKFVEWFHGESDKIPMGRSLICNIPLKRSYEGNVVCVHLDNFKNQCRLVLCTTVENEEQMKKLAATKLGEFGFGEYAPLKR